MLKFKVPELSDKPWVDSCLQHANSLNCEYTFGMQFIWAKAYHTQICHYKDFFICRWGDENEISYSVPLGEGDFSEAIEEIIADAKLLGVQPRIYGVTQGYLDMLQEAFTGKFKYHYDESYYDYIYDVEKLQNLSGKKYHGKRNHITNFKKNHPNWQFEKIDVDNITECITLHQKWIDEKSDEDNEAYREEFEAVREAFAHYHALGFVGGLIRIEGKVVAFTMGEPQQNGKCFVTHFEKAYGDMQGAYPIINQEFARHCLRAYKYVNREEDLGLEGLRKAKESYHPEIKLEKCVAVYEG